MPVERRPLDTPLRELVGKSEDEAVQWWSGRLNAVASIPSATGRAGALVPTYRELASLPKAQRIALTRARVIAALQLPDEQLERIFEARRIAAQQAPDVEKDDDAIFVNEVVPTLSLDMQERIRRRMATTEV